VQIAVLLRLGVCRESVLAVLAAHSTWDYEIYATIPYCRGNLRNGLHDAKGS
jgi:hypothetical protein